MAKADLGIKRLCAECGTKYYDFGRQPILCPKCGAEFAETVKAAPRPAAKPEVVKEEPETVGAEQTVSLDEADKEQAATGGKGPAVEDDFEVEDEALGDDDADDTFLEAEEDDDDPDVSGIIGGGIDANDEDI